MEEVEDKKQKLLIEYSLANRDVFIKVARILKPSYFEKPLDRVVEMVMEYFHEYHNIPKVKVIEAETGVKLDVQEELEDDDVLYLIDELETFCQEQAMTQAILDSVDKVKEGNITEVQDIVREALLVRIDDSVGTSLFDDAYNRIMMTDAANDERAIGIPDFDRLIGNIRRGELLMVYAPSAGGKSIFLANYAERLALQKLNVCIISLELNESLYSKRLDSILTEIGIKEHMESAKQISEMLESIKDEVGNITTKKMPFKTKVSDIRAYLMEYHLKYGRYPDVLVVDYLALLGARSSTQGKGISEEQGEIAVDLRQVSEDFNMYMASAGQITREGQNITDIHPGHVAGGMSVINGSDTSIAFVANEQDINNNQVQCRELKLRNAPKTTEPVILYKCPRTLRMSDKPFNGSSKSPMNTTSNPLPTGKGKQKLADALKR